MESEETKRVSSKERIGPLTLGPALPPSHGAERFEAISPEQRAAIVWRWPAPALERVSVPGFAHLIDTIRDVEIAGIAQILHGSVATEHAVIAFTRPAGDPLRDYLLRGKMSPLEAVTSALTLLDALIALRSFGVRGAWWTPSTLWVTEDEAQWTLSTPGLTSTLRITEPTHLEEVAFRAPELATCKDPSELEDQVYAAVAAYAVGATLFYSLINRLPYDNDEPGAYVAAQQSVVAPRVEDQDENLVPHKVLSEIIHCCLSRDPALRPHSLEAVRRSLEEAEQEARFQHSRVDYLPARVSETHKMPRPNRAGEGEKPPEESPSRFLPLLALVALVAIALFLIGR
jgi:serine/threonine protein kinase